MRSRAYALPVLFTGLAQITAILFAYQLSPLLGAVSFQPVSGQPVANALIFLLLPVAGTLAYLRVRKRKHVKAFYAAMESLLVFFLTLLILSFSYLPAPLSLAAAAAVGLFGFVSISRDMRFSKAVVALLMSSEAGAYLAIILPAPMVYLVFLFFALYDVVAVFKGPLKRLIEEPGFAMLSMEFGSLTMGMGDEIFYSMVPATALLLGGIYPALLSALIIDLGMVATLVLLERRKALPGLTIPLLLSLVYLLFFVR
ncbi:MAG: hypothetical protein JRN39_06730 [Nitrososphaerota archaeon]|nr:hypothetical protein [Nitrososphaerota archaeon]